MCRLIRMDLRLVWLIVGALCWWGQVGVGGAMEVETELEEAFEKAKGLLPEPLRERVADVGLGRARDLGVPEHAAFADRLMQRAAFMIFNIMSREVTVLDSGVAGRAWWGQPPPEMSELLPFLAGVADVLGVDAPDDVEDVAFGVAWQAFVARVFSWRGEVVPDPVPSPGEVAVLDRFLEDGVWRSLGGEAGLVELMVHELGHAIQLDRRCDMLGRMTSWATLSGFVRTADGMPANGYAAGRFAVEDSLVLARMILAGERAGVTRGASALYQPAEKSRFVNCYAEFDLREDYAECFRLMVLKPELLAKAAPVKFLYLNALGLNADFDRAKPGPLWYAGAELEHLLPRDTVRLVMARVLGEDGRGLCPLTLAAILRAHAAELTVEDLPEPNEVVAWPRELPGELREVVAPERLQVEIGGVIYVPSVEAQVRWRDKEVAKWFQLKELEALLEDGQKGEK